MRLYAGVIDALGDRKEQVRDIAIKVLEIHTGQRKGFRPAAGEEERAAAIARWRSWLDEYRAQL